MAVPHQKSSSLTLSFRIFGACVISLATSALVKPASAATFRALGDVSSAGMGTLVRNFSADGNVIVGTSPGTFGYAFRWTDATGFVPLGKISNSSGVYLYEGLSTAISQDGAVIVGQLGAGLSTAPALSFYWTAATGFQRPAGLPDFTTALSADGKVVAGWMISSGYKGRIWRFNGSTVDLGDRATPSALSSDGSVAVGGQAVVYGQPIVAFRWTATGGTSSLGVLDGDTSSNAVWVSADGAAVQGVSSNSTSARMFKWTEATGMQPVGEDFPYIQTVWNSFTSDGNFAVGRETIPQHPVPVYGLSPSGETIQTGWKLVPAEDRLVYWTPEGGVADLKTLLSERTGVDLTEWVLSEPAYVSADGKTVCGTGAKTGAGGPWIVSALDEPAPTPTSTPEATPTPSVSPSPPPDSGFQDIPPTSNIAQQKAIRARMKILRDRMKDVRQMEPGLARDRKIKSLRTKMRRFQHKLAAASS